MDREPVSTRNIVALLLGLLLSVALLIGRTVRRQVRISERLNDRAAWQVAEARAAGLKQAEAAELEAAKVLVGEALEAARQGRWDTYRALLADGVAEVFHGVVLWEQPPLAAFEIVGARLDDSGFAVVTVHESHVKNQPPSAARTLEYNVRNGTITMRSAPRERVDAAKARLKEPFERWVTSLVQRVRFTAALREAVGAEESAVGLIYRLRHGGVAQAMGLEGDEALLRAVRPLLKSARYDLTGEDERAAWEVLADSGESFYVESPVPPAGRAGR